MTASPMTDAVIAGLRRIAEIEDPIVCQQCLGRIAHVLHQLRHPMHAGEIDEADAKKSLTMLANSACVLEDKILLVGAATDDQKATALESVERHAHGLLAMLDVEPTVVHQPE